MANELLDEILGYLSPADIASLGQVDKTHHDDEAIGYSLGVAKLHRQYSQLESGSMHLSLQQWNELVDHIDTASISLQTQSGGPLTRGILRQDRAELFCRLAGKIELVQDNFRWNAMQFMCDAIRTRTLADSPRTQAQVLVALTGNIVDLLEAHRTDAFNEIWSAAAVLPAAEQCMALAALSREISSLSELDRLDAFNDIRELAVTLRPFEQSVMLAALSERIMSLSLEDRSDAFHSIRVAAADLPAAEQSMVLAALSEHIFSPLWVDSPLEFSWVDNPAEFNSMRAAAEALPAAEQSVVLAALSGGIVNLPVENACNAFGSIRVAAVGLPAAEQSMVLAALSREISSLSELDRLGAFNYIRAAANILPAAERSVVLAALSGEIPSLFNLVNLGAFNEILAAANDLPAAERSVVLVALSGEILSLFNTDNLEAFNSLRDAAIGLPPAGKSAVLAALAGVIPGPPDADMLPGFNSLRDAAVGLPPDKESAVLTTLADKIVNFPQERGHDAFNSLRDAAFALLGTFNITSDAAVALPAAQTAAAVLVTLASKIGNLSQGRKREAFNGTWDAASALLSAFNSIRDNADALPLAAKSAAVLTELADKIAHLPETERLGAYNRLRDAAATLPSATKSVLLATLVNQIRHLNADDRSDAFVAFDSVSDTRVQSALIRNLKHVTAGQDALTELRDIMTRSSVLSDLSRVEVLKTIAREIRDFPPSQGKSGIVQGLHEAADGLAAPLRIALKIQLPLPQIQNA
ncbi:hypothetical protein ACFQUU_21920 [Herbaspirillum sp. GCM10030257]|uniref:hypothetical protein n=1 Tax=Herbaspirillum sp. GCM10030257 TaxID=3273393 RepID=UPI003605CF6F